MLVPQDQNCTQEAPTKMLWGEMCGYLIQMFTEFSQQPMVVLHIFFYLWLIPASVETEDWSRCALFLSREDRMGLRMKCLLITSSLIRGRAGAQRKCQREQP